MTLAAESELMMKFGICEICNEPAKVGINDADLNLHFSCIKHMTELWEKIGKP